MYVLKWKIIIIGYIVHYFPVYIPTDNINIIF